MLAAMVAGAARAADASEAVILLSNGDRAVGELVASGDREHFVWKSPGFGGPFQFSLASVEGIRFPPPREFPQAEGAYFFELVGGDLLVGTLKALDEESAVVEVPRLGTLHIDRAVLRRMQRRTNSEFVFSGLTGLDGWEVSGKDGGWREDAGHFVASDKGTGIYRDLNIPGKARLEIDLSWTAKPNFKLSLGVKKGVKTKLSSNSVEVWGDRLVAVCESERDGDVSVLKQLSSEPGRISLEIYLDQPGGHMLVASADGKLLADLKVASKNRQTFGGLSIDNLGGDLRVENLRIYKWNAEPPQIGPPDQTKVLLAGGTTEVGTVRSYDAAQNQFVVKFNDGERRVPADEMAGCTFGATAEVASGNLRVVLLSGMRISGNLVRVEGDRVFVKSSGIREPWSPEFGTLQAITVVRPERDPPKQEGRIGRLEMDGVTLHGRLVDGDVGKNSCLVWQPIASSVASPLERGASARVIYREPPPPVSHPAAGSTPKVRRLAVHQDVLRQLRIHGLRRDNVEPSAVAPAECVLHLRSGDKLPCTMASIDENGILFKSPVTDATFIPHESVKVLELLPNAAPVHIAKEKRDRLLTLPRMQRDSPPTQLIRAVNGDYLRGRLVAMDDKNLQVEIRLETKTIPRENVARIIWLHADETDQAASPPADEQQSATRVQAIPPNGNRLTFEAKQVAAGILTGQSKLLGNCRVDLNEIDKLLVGSAIEEAAAALVFHNWRLTPSLDPLEFQENGLAEDASIEGVESALVGKPAPDFELQSLEGGKFRLSDRKDKVLVLDFWASWCGPCLQAMPQVHAVAREFADQQVELVAVNLQETPEQIKAALERLGLTMTVVLDRDGLVAEKYGATAIPQTVVIDRDGKVARLFVGGGPRFDETLRQALQSLLSAGGDQPDAQP